MPKPHSDIGLIGLAVMGQNLALNIADHGFSVAGLDTANRVSVSARGEAGMALVATTCWDGAA